MSITQSSIEEVLNKLEELLEQITALRQRVAQLDSEMADELNQAQKEYNEQLGHLNTKARKLRARKAMLKTQIAQYNAPEATEQEDSDLDMDKPGITPPEEELPSIEDPEFPKPPPMAPRMVRKRELADHIYYFLDQDEETVMQEINAVFEDESTDVGNMLELLAWGEIWSVRPEWESLNDQHQRLQQWLQALQARLAYWKGQVQRCESESRYSLWKIKCRGEAEWQAYLESLVEKQTKENTRLKREILVLKGELHTMKKEL